MAGGCPPEPTLAGGYSSIRRIEAPPPARLWGGFEYLARTLSMKPVDGESSVAADPRAAGPVPPVDARRPEPPQIRVDSVLAFGGGGGGTVNWRMRRRGRLAGAMASRRPRSTCPRTWRRRGRLNSHILAVRAVVPNISKMSKESTLCPVRKKADSVLPS
ncbi:hypothetical protein PAHAL_6G094300 [Panicum hallii]|uniref:Uncharacterized protein n=1 Tax=Panicum hallii TaxID=206008 RepID=A0A2S3I214_9POAL|nr:uncharacterized protein LOC112897434 [Panicum hallii]PAN34976.1 hypothetical protein PAHAL_6G094300 [Panicum hallii]